LVTSSVVVRVSSRRLPGGSSSEKTMRLASSRGMKPDGRKPIA
jgi:hypothetical protein